ncbi:MAG: 3',5'-cyclic-AMP phosphodiesterase [Gammaproteobacteria bacterium]|jgi:Icc protein|nr:3',5'-cyclic-AMP phosphodiesterase [Gammaproteobacteria bacterium]
MAADQHTPVTLDPRDEVVRVVQLTDSHLDGEPGGKLLDMDTDHSLQAVITQVLAQRPHNDLVLATGDLADGGAAPAYVRLAGYLERFSCPSFWLPGNHDVREAMERGCSGQSRMGREILIGNWQILMLDSQIPGAVGGGLGTEELAFLERSLQAATEQGLHALVVLHHHPVPMGSEWIDEQVVVDADEFFAVTDRYPAAKAILWGHVHQERDEQRNTARLLSTPSTCVQFAPGSVDFKADDKPPGYRWLDLHPDGRIETGVARVTDVHFTVDLQRGGYL